MPFYGIGILPTNLQIQIFFATFSRNHKGILTYFSAAFGGQRRDLSNPQPQL
jgi:hypothetical protein